MEQNRQSPCVTTCLMDGFRCRLCLKTSDLDLQPLFPPGEDCFLNDLLSQIYDCLAIHVSFLEDFCSVICSNCREHINSFYIFKKQCQSNDGYLREKRLKEIKGMERERTTAPESPKEMDPDLEANQGKVKEPQQEELLDQADKIFFPKENPTEEVLEPVVKCVDKVDVGVQMCGASSSESFCGFADEFYARRSPRIFIKNSITEAYEMISAPSTTMEETQECHVPLEKLDLQPTTSVKPPPVNRVKTPIAPKINSRKQSRAAIHVKETPRLLRQKAVLYYDGFEYRKPRTCHDGTTEWACCKVSCPATLEQKAGGTLKLMAKHKQHPAQVIRDSLVIDRKSRKWVPLIVTDNNRRRKVICDDAFRYRFSQKLPNGQTVWACEAQQGGCKALLRIVGDYRTVSKVFQHNHAETIMVRRRGATKPIKLQRIVDRKLVKKT